MLPGVFLSFSDRDSKPNYAGRQQALLLLNVSLIYQSRGAFVFFSGSLSPLQQKPEDFPGKQEAAGLLV